MLKFQKYTIQKKHLPPFVVCLLLCFIVVFNPKDVTSSSAQSVASKASAKGVQHGISSKVAADSLGAEPICQDGCLVETQLGRLPVIVFGVVLKIVKNTHVYIYICELYLFIYIYIYIANGVILWSLDLFS